MAALVHTCQVAPEQTDAIIDRFNRTCSPTIQNPREVGAGVRVDSLLPPSGGAQEWETRRAMTWRTRSRDGRGGAERLSTCEILILSE